MPFYCIITSTQEKESFKVEGKKNMIWVEVDKIFRENDAQELNDELYGTGYLARLSKFIRERDVKLAEENKLLEARKAARMAKQSVSEEEMSAGI